jgi:hypothetical protein
MEAKQTIISGRIRRQKAAQEKKQFWLSLSVAGFLLVLGVLLVGSLTGCTEGDTYISPTIPCCNDGCVGDHTPETNPACTQKEPTEPKVFAWICKNGVQKKIYEFNLNKWLRKGWTEGKCKQTPPGDDDDDDVITDDKVCICHIPPGNPDNRHVICIGEPAVNAHFTNHGDYYAPCYPVPGD